IIKYPISEEKVIIDALSKTHLIILIIRRKNIQYLEVIITKKTPLFSKKELHCLNTLGILKIKNSNKINWFY
ncbi:MAG: hypothetical protein ACXACB_10190, partial [Promethearchaeota archaeon]